MARTPLDSLSATYSTSFCKESPEGWASAASGPKPSTSASRPLPATGSMVPSSRAMTATWCEPASATYSSLPRSARSHGERSGVSSARVRCDSGARPSSQVPARRCKVRSRRSARNTACARASAM